MWIKGCLAIVLGFLLASGAFAQTKYTINGYVKDAANGEMLIGATIFVREISVSHHQRVWLLCHHPSGR